MRHRKRDLEFAVGGLCVVGVTDGEARDREISVFGNGEGRGDGCRCRGVIHRRHRDGNGLSDRIRETVRHDIGDDRESPEANIVIIIQRQCDRTILPDGNAALAGHYGFLSIGIGGRISSDGEAAHRERIVIRVRRGGTAVSQNIEGRRGVFGRGDCLVLCDWDFIDEDGQRAGVRAVSLTRAVGNGIGDLRNASVFIGCATQETGQWGEREITIGADPDRALARDSRQLAGCILGLITKNEELGDRQ